MFAPNPFGGKGRVDKRVRADATQSLSIQTKKKWFRESWPPYHLRSRKRDPSLVSSKWMPSPTSNPWSQSSFLHGKGSWAPLGLFQWQGWKATGFLRHQAPQALKRPMNEDPFVSELKERVHPCHPTLTLPRFRIERVIQQPILGRVEWMQ